MRNCKQALYTNSERLNRTLINYHSLSLWLEVTPQPSQDDLPISFHSVCGDVVNDRHHHVILQLHAATHLVSLAKMTCAGAVISQPVESTIPDNTAMSSEVLKKEKEKNTIENAGHLPIIGHIIRE